MSWLKKKGLIYFTTYTRLRRLWNSRIPFTIIFMYYTCKPFSWITLSNAENCILDCYNLTTNIVLITNYLVTGKFLYIDVYCQQVVGVASVGVRGVVGNSAPAQLYYAPVAQHAPIINVPQHTPVTPVAQHVPLASVPHQALPRTLAPYMHQQQSQPQPSQSQGKT